MKRRRAIFLLCLYCGNKCLEFFFLLLFLLGEVTRFSIGRTYYSDTQSV